MIEESLSAIKNYCGFKETPELIRYLHGGDINRVYLIAGDSRLWVVKQNSSYDFPDMLAKEFHSLKYLLDKSLLRYPSPLISFAEKNQQYLIMEYIEQGRNSPSAQENLGRGLAQQHQVTQNWFGWTEDNYIGSLIQINTPTPEWNEFYAVNRILPQTQKCFDKGLLSKQDVGGLEKICLHLKDLIPEENPALLHGDLWGGNYFISSDGQPVLYDPAIYFGHREMDLAMTQLFGGFSDEFYASYQSAFPLAKDWEKRVNLFQLYPVMVHLNLFGSSYLPSVRDIIRMYG